jgi:hypothetical protein
MKTLIQQWTPSKMDLSQDHLMMAPNSPYDVKCLSEDKFQGLFDETIEVSSKLDGEVQNKR